MSEEYLQSDLARAIETHSIESVENLNKSETVFYICDVLGVEPPEAHPSEHNGTVPRSLSQEWAKILAEEAEENSEENNDESEEDN
ncbi:hypothetical protein [His 1 virus]|uniref:Uncharacterized protein ORF29 n=1 Tax=His1 virus (isolate Australia/Victoria) TaxID=654912 RepID=Y029_HIS1I|nr:hypothetical protein His1V_gp29 [His 1 virus]Q25BG6.1 RecName: Full=Uncharacterized protein ORF29 [His1 virus (isolate Victoria)]AAQ13749.1 hypothetical protein [His 1 virus]